MVAYPVPLHCSDGERDGAGRLGGGGAGLLGGDCTSIVDSELGCFTAMVVSADVEGALMVSLWAC